VDDELLRAAVKIIIALPLVTALAYFLIKYGLARRPFSVGQNRRMRVVEQIAIGPKTMLSLVEVGGQYMLLAHSDSGIKLIKELDQLPAPVLQQSEVDLRGILGNLKMPGAQQGLLGKILFRKEK